MARTALITGITGQDGSYLTELLLGKGYVVHGIVRRASTMNRDRLEPMRRDPGIYGKQLFLHYADLHDATTLRRILRQCVPDEMYHLAGQSHVGLSFEIPESTCNEVALGTLSLLEICRDLPRPVRLFHASSAEIFGQPGPADVPQNEATRYRPSSPYGCAKAFATDLCRVYRQAHGAFVCSGIMYNHESPRRGEGFVTRKISSSVARIVRGQQEVLELGNLSAGRDWGYAPEYVEAMWQMLQPPQADDFVLATGRVHTVRDFVCAAFASAEVELCFEGAGESEVGRDKKTGRVLVRVNPHFFRPADPATLVGDAGLAEKRLGWRARTDAPALAALMTRAELGMTKPE